MLPVFKLITDCEGGIEYAGEQVFASFGSEQRGDPQPKIPL
jgi:hypothetical protein